MSLEIVADNTPEDIQDYKIGLQIQHIACKICKLRRDIAICEIRDFYDNCSMGDRCRAKIT